MPIWLLRLFHLIGLTNLTDEQVERYAKMLPYQERVVEEKTQLDDKLSRLAAFVGSDGYNTLPGEEQARLSFQLLLMNAYSNVLSERIAAFS